MIAVADEEFLWSRMRIQLRRLVEGNGKAEDRQKGCKSQSGLIVFTAVDMRKPIERKRWDFGLPCFLAHQKIKVRRQALCRTGAGLQRDLAAQAGPCCGRRPPSRFLGRKRKELRVHALGACPTGAARHAQFTPLLVPFA